MHRESAQFRYIKIAQEIRSEILRGELGKGTRLPSERDLGQRFRVQRNTIRQALSVLENEGHIATEGRRGSYVQQSQLQGGTFLINVHRGSGPNLTALVEGFTQSAEKTGFKVRRRSTNPMKDSAMNVVPDPANLPNDAAGLVLWPHYPSDAERIRILNEKLPLILVDQHVMGVTTDCVLFDDVTGGRLITEHLLTLGHKKIAFLTDEVFAETVRARWQGYVLAHENAGIFCDPRLSLLYQLLDQHIFATTMRQLMADASVRPTAVVCSNDLVAFGLLRFLQAEGLRVPDDIAVTGYGNSMPDYMAALSLTTIDQPFQEMGRSAARLLCERTGQSSAQRLGSPQEIILPITLVVRGSTTSDTVRA